MQIINNEIHINKHYANRIWIQEEAQTPSLPFLPVDVAQAECDWGVLRPSECMASGLLLCLFLSDRKHHYSLWMTEG